MTDPDDLAARMADDLALLERTRMPFGKYGPAHYPPRGVPIYDLPLEYLAWFARKGSWPAGKLGHVMQIVHQLKVEGGEAVFDPMRERAGGKTVLHPSKGKRKFSFGDTAP